MNIIQIKEVLDSLGVEAGSDDIFDQRIWLFANYSYCIEPAASCSWWDGDPSSWEIYQLTPGGAGSSGRVSDEFELQDWLINECTTN